LYAQNDEPVFKGNYVSRATGGMRGLTILGRCFDFFSSNALTRRNDSEFFDDVIGELDVASLSVKYSRKPAI
jgi:hypothetical protein